MIVSRWISIEAGPTYEHGVQVGPGETVAAALARLAGEVDLEVRRRTARGDVVRGVYDADPLEVARVTPDAESGEPLTVRASARPWARSASQDCRACGGEGHVYGPCRASSTECCGGDCGPRRTCPECDGDGVVEDEGDEV